MSRIRIQVALALVAAVVLGLPGCGGESHDEAGHEGHDHGGPAEPAHAHSAPHGGSLVVCGEEFAHVELVLDAASGELTVYCLGSHAEQPVRVVQPVLTLEIRAGDTEFDLELAAVASELTGETVGDTSMFRATDARLVGVERFEGVLRQVTMKGTAFAAVPLRYPGRDGD